jgi:hypothetical protein
MTVMTLETYYTIMSIQSPCGSRAAALFELTYRRVWRPELSMRVGDATSWLNRRKLQQSKSVAYATS